VESALITLKAAGSVPAAVGQRDPAQLDGRIDLAEIARQIPHTLRLREGVTLDSGSATVRAVVAEDAGRTRIDLEARLADVRGRDRSRSFSLRDPATLSARLWRTGGGLDLERLKAETPYLNAEARGSLGTGLTLSGRVDLTGLQRQVGEIVELGGYRLAGSSTFEGDFRSVDGRFRSRLDAELHGVDLVTPALSLQRESVRLSLRSTGPAEASGWPAGWSEVRSRLEAGPTSAELTATSTAAATGPGRWDLAVNGPVTVGGRSARGEGHVVGRWAGPVLMLDPIRLSLQPDDDELGSPDASAIRLDARGQYDRDRGELVVRPSAVGRKSGAAVALVDDGVRVSGLGTGGGLRFDGGLTGDVGSLAAWVDGSPAGLRGRWSARAEGRSDADGLRFGGRVDAEGLGWGADGGTPETLSLAVQGLVPESGGRVDLSEFSVRTRYGSSEATGRLDDPAGRRVLELQGRLTPAWDAISARLTDRVEPGAWVEGRARPWRLRVALDDRWRESLNGEVGLELDGADVYGLEFGPASVVARAVEGRLTFDPVETTVNEGRLRLVPEYRPASVDEGGGPALRLGPGTALTDVRVNDDVSRRVLSFVAPVLDNATRVRGRVSARLDEATFPIGADRGRGPTVTGSVEFQDVEFAPGPLADLFYGLVGRDDRPTVKINQPVSLSIADRRVYQKGLSVPLGPVARVDLEGWVDFDRNINLMASLPVTPAIVADRPVLKGLIGGNAIKIPVRGTLQKPEIDPDAWNLALREMGRNFVENGLANGAAGLIERLTRPRDPDAPPPPPRLTPEQRKARRQERREERRRQRGP